MSDEWYYKVDGSFDNKKRGPISIDELRRLVTIGEVLPDHLVWHEGMEGDWIPASKVEGLFDSRAKLDSPTAESWFYDDAGQRLGPVSTEEMESLISKGKIQRGTAIWRRGFSEWTNAEDSELAGLLNEVGPPPLSGEHVDNSIVWILAFAPLIGILLQGLVLGIAYPSEDQALVALRTGEMWYITPLLNIALAIADERKLTKAGHDTSRFSAWCWLVPVYLYQRHMALRQDISYFVTWMVCFFIILVG